MHSPSSMNRRSFLVRSGTAAMSLSMLSARGANPPSAVKKIKLGLIGCGGRGTWIADLFLKHGGYELAACADYFQDRVDACGDRFGVPPARRFTTLSGYKRLLESGVEAVAIESPPYFHPGQAADAVDAGKHVYLAKPIAVDAAGCRSVEASGRKAEDNKLCFLVDFQTRTSTYYREAIQRVHQGALGDLAFGEATYHAGIPWGGHMTALAAHPDDPEVRLRAWGLSKILSGDVITEQNIHTLDVMSWIMNEPPLYAVGTGARKVREIGDCFDHFACLYQYANQVGITFSSRQFNGHDSKPDGIRNRMFGAKGVLETEYAGNVLLRGENFYRGGNQPSLYGDGAIANIATFHENIRGGAPANDTVTPSVRSNLVSLLGRSAAYRQDRVTWEETVGDRTPLEYDLRGLRA